LRERREHLTRRVLLIADAGPRRGLGHISRSSAVATALAVRGFETRQLAYGTETPIERDGLIWEPIDHAGGGDERWGVVVLDSYSLRADELEVGDALMPLVVLQETTEPSPEARLVVNAGADPAEAGPHQLYGFAYAALRPHFWGAPPARPRERVEHVLVTTGAGDVGGAAATFAAAVRDALPSSRVTRVQGPFGAPEEVAGVEVARTPDSLLELLLDADLVVCAGGQTMLEAAAVGAPCVTVAVTQNQAAQVKRLADLGAVRATSLENIGEIVFELGADAPARRELARRAQTAIDSYGALRVAFAVARLTSA
jgi:spore coat polysaccharide biosynthesis predicted glycosyltransferase SpsG